MSYENKLNLAYGAGQQLQK